MSIRIGLTSLCIDHGYKGDNGLGYARVKHYVDGKRVREGRHVKALREYLGLPVGATKGKVVRHKCDNPRCINPEHLELGTYRDNIHDMLSRKRNRTIVPLGERHGGCKLSDEDVLAIKAKYVRNSKEFGSVALASEYGVTHSQILLIVQGLSRTQGTGAKEYRA